MKSGKKKISKGRIVLCIIAVFLMLLWLFPYYYLVLQSIVPWTEVDKRVLTTEFSLDSYRYLFGGNGAADPFQWVRALLNSFLVSVPTAVITIVVGLLTGYAAVHMRYKGKGFIHSSLLFQMFFPVVVLLVPRYMIVSPLANRYLGMILPLSVSIWGVFMYMNYFRTVPPAVFEAAKIDGAGPFRIYWSVVLPDIRPAIGSIGIFTAMMQWNDYLNPLLMLNDMEKMTMPLGLVIFNSQRTSDLSATMAAATMIMMPMIIIFVMFQKQFIKGMTMSGIK